MPIYSVLLATAYEKRKIIVHGDYSVSFDGIEDFGNINWHSIPAKGYMLVFCRTRSVYSGRWTRTRVPNRWLLLKHDSKKVCIEAVQIDCGRNKETAKQYLLENYLK